MSAVAGSRQTAPPGGVPALGGGSMNNAPPLGGGGPQINEDIKVPDKMVGLSKKICFFLSITYSYPCTIVSRF